MLLLPGARVRTEHGLPWDEGSPCSRFKTDPPGRAISGEQTNLIPGCQPYHGLSGLLAVPPESIQEERVLPSGFLASISPWAAAGLLSSCPILPPPCSSPPRPQPFPCDEINVIFMSEECHSGVLQIRWLKQITLTRWRPEVRKLRSSQRLPGQVLQAVLAPDAPLPKGISRPCPFAPVSFLLCPSPPFF